MISRTRDRLWLRRYSREVGFCEAATMESTGFGNIVAVLTNDLLESDLLLIETFRNLPRSGSINYSLETPYRRSSFFSRTLSHFALQKPAFMGKHPFHKKGSGERKKTTAPLKGAKYERMNIWKQIFFDELLSISYCYSCLKWSFFLQAAAEKLKRE